VDNSRVKFGTLKYINNNNIGAMSMISFFFPVEEYDARASLPLSNTSSSSVAAHEDGENPKEEREVKPSHFVLNLPFNVIK